MSAAARPVQLDLSDSAEAWRASGRDPGRQIGLRTRVSEVRTRKFDSARRSTQVLCARAWGRPAQSASRARRMAQATAGLPQSCHGTTSACGPQGLIPEALREGVPTWS